jgi:D-alanine transaminase
MNDLIWINGETMPFADARVGVEDRGYQFGDGVYEVIKLYDGKPFTLREHLDRLEKSAAGIQLQLPLRAEALADEVRKFVGKTGAREGMVYLQATRGVAPRNHLYPERAKPVVLFYTRELPAIPAPGAAPGTKLLAVPDERWKRCWVKSIALLANVLAKNTAVAAGADEAVFVDEGVVNECSASNYFAVISGRLVTHPVGPKVLPGITRQVLLDVCRELKIEVQERPLRLQEAVAADEMFITSTTREISWVSHWDDKVVATKCGPVTLKLHQGLRERVARETA